MDVYVAISAKVKKTLDIDIICDIIVWMAREVTRDFLLRLPPELFRELEREAKNEGSSRTKLVRKALIEYFDKRDLVGDLMSERAKELAPKARAATQK